MLQCERRQEYIDIIMQVCALSQRFLRSILYFPTVRIRPTPLQLSEDDQTTLKSLVEDILSAGDGGDDVEEEEGGVEEAAGIAGASSSNRSTPSRLKSPLASAHETARLVALSTNSPAAVLALECRERGLPRLGAIAARVALASPPPTKAAAAAAAGQPPVELEGKSRRQLEWDCASLREEVVRTEIYSPFMRTTLRATAMRILSPCRLILRLHWLVARRLSYGPQLIRRSPPAVRTPLPLQGSRRSSLPPPRHRM